MWPTPLLVDHRGDGLIFYKVHQMSAEKLHKSTLVNGGNLLAPDFSGMVLYASDSWDTLDWNNTSFNWTWLINCYRFCALFSVILIINCGGSQEIRIMIYCILLTLIHLIHCAQFEHKVRLHMRRNCGVVWCMCVDIPEPRPPGVDQSQRGAVVNQESATSRQIGHKGNIGPNK